MTSILRTPNERFLSIPDYPFQAHFIDDLRGFEGIRVHYLDEGTPSSRETFLCLHGEPTWSYLYRKMIPVLRDQGFRVIAPDLIGFGKSDKPIDDAIHTFEFHRNMLMRLIERLNLNRITLVCQDWGGLLGLTIPMEMPERFHRLIVMNTTLATGDVPMSEGFLKWREWVAKNPDLDIARLMQRSEPTLSTDECAAYAAPFPTIKYKAGIRALPAMVPDHLNAPGAALSRKARDWWRHEWNGQSFMAVGAKDPVVGPETMSVLRQNIRGCPEPFHLNEAGHFVQEHGKKVLAAAFMHFGLTR